MKKISLASLLLLSFFSASAQEKNATDIYHEIEKLVSPYRVLYLAAHPDDENTRLISYFANEVKASTAYLSLTRGDGGQNLIGDEKGDLLGVLRTQELLAAREIDGGRQFFTRAVDFGYSKSSTETFAFWEKDRILSDVVYIFRYFKPHIVINRFPTENYGGHGHHLASAILSEEAFSISAQHDRYTDQLQELSPWNVGTLFFNNSSWWDKSLDERARNDFSITGLDVGTYNDLLGYSYNELAAYSRSQHKSQGFGAAPQRGEQIEYLEYLKGQFNPGQLLHEQLLDSLDRAWLNLEGDFKNILESYDFQQPSASVEGLLALKQKAEAINIDGRFTAKINSLAEIISSCMGLSIEIIAESASYVRGDSLVVDIEVINRSHLPLKLASVTFDSTFQSWNRDLNENQMFRDTMLIVIDEEEAFTTPYWLVKPHDKSFDHDQELLKNPVGPSLSCQVKLEIDGTSLTYDRKIIYKWTDRVKGGLTRPIRVLPDYLVDFDQGIYFSSDSTFQGIVFIRSNTGADQDVNLEFEENQSMDLPSIRNLNLPSMTTISEQFKGELKSAGKNGMDISFSDQDSSISHYSLLEINFDHIEPVDVLLKPKARVLPVELKEGPGKIAYVEGPDNEMITYLQRFGLDITSFTMEDLMEGKLKEYKVLLFGIRSLNVDPTWNEHAAEIQEFIKGGGLVVMQYQTSRGINPVEISPYAFNISRMRVTDENSSANISRKNHAILNYPNVLSAEDFKGWNQERGLYFADSWSEDFTTVLSWHDKDELDQFGSLIIGDFGKGAFIYTGISFFRHIPFGVPGSYKLLTNILSYDPSR